MNDETTKLELPPFYTLKITQPEPNYNVCFHKDGTTIGTLDFSGGVLKFDGEAEESAKLFFNLIADLFKRRLERERAEEREACARICDSLNMNTFHIPFAAVEMCAAAIRARLESPQDREEYPASTTVAVPNPNNHEDI